ncbi:hypothetical protein ACS0TY_019878 [Phlomoides rotata]
MRTFAFIVFITASSVFCVESSINLGSFLDARENGSSWVSASGEFAFGFRPQPPVDHHQVLYLLAIWFEKLPEKTIVWSKNRYPVPQESRIQVTEQGQLILSDPWGKEIWRAPIGNGISTGASMLDSGNFVLEYGNTSLWESFAYPTDTMLPGQRLNKGGNITCRVSETNYTEGRFMLTMKGDGNLAIYPLYMPTEYLDSPLWASNTAGVADTDSQLIFDTSGYLYIQQGNETSTNVTKKELGSQQGFYYMARLDFEGVLRLYIRARARINLLASLWTPIQTVPEDICDAPYGNRGPGACGYNSICVSTNGRPDCFCPQGYSLSNPHDSRSDCLPDFQMPSCHHNDYSHTYFVELNSTNWPGGDYDIQDMANKDMCKQSCLRDCNCASVFYSTTNRCYKKKFPLSNGRQTDDQKDITAFIKVVRSPQPQTSTSGGNGTSKVIILSAFLGSSAFLNFLLLIAIALAVFFVCHKKLLNSPNSLSTVHGIKVYSYKQLEEATGGFKQQVGRGSFGSVYKGVLPSIPRIDVAIKRLDKVKKEGEKEFTTEVSAIGRTHHKNLVTLLGYCDEGDHCLLVYEYMSNGSLAAHLFGSLRPHWNQRMQIAIGIARGLTYLHDECSTQIIHCDVKPQNILLDEFLAPKISDFGMAKLLLSEQSRAARTHIRGTVGYFAPEWFRKASITAKVDVYSFGAMLLEIICCKSSVEFGLGDQEEALIDWVYDCYSKRKLNKLVENDDEAWNDMESVERLVTVGIWCIQEDPNLRPSMRNVAQMLEGVAQVSVPPRPSGYSHA